MEASGRWILAAAMVAAAACGPGVPPQSSRPSADAIQTGADGTALRGAALENGSEGLFPTDGSGLDDCVKIENAAIGAIQTFDVANITIEIEAWRPKDGERGEFVGFSFTASSPVVYAVKTGGETHTGSSGTWAHPNGTTGEDVPAISNVTFCPAPAGGTSGNGGGSSTGGTSTGGTTGSTSGVN